MPGLKSIFEMIRSVWWNGRKKRRAMCRQRICAFLSTMMAQDASPNCEPVAGKG